MRFHIENRFGKVSFEQLYRETERVDTELCNPFTSIQVMTCEDRDTYNYSTVTFDDQRVTEALKKRKTYSWEEFSREIWQRSYRVDVIIRKHFHKEFAIRLSVDRFSDPKSVFFCGHSLEESLEERIKKMCVWPSITRKIGDGFHKSSEFNLLFGQFITGIGKE